MSDTSLSSDLSTLRRIFCGSCSFLVENWTIDGKNLSVNGWYLSEYESSIGFRVNGKRVKTESLALPSPSLAKVFPFFQSSASSAFRFEYDLSANDLDLGIAEITLCDNLLGDPLNRWHSVSIPLTTDSFELPSHDQLMRTQGNTSVARYLIYGYTVAARIEAIVDRYFNDSLTDKFVLDWGVGCGRVARHLVGKCRSFMGFDIDKLNVDWCIKHLPGQYGTNETSPPLPVEDGTVDLVYGISVFTHLTHESAAAWRDEIARVLKPGGMCIVTVHGVTGISRILDDSLLLKIIDEGFDASTSDARLDGVVEDASYYRAAYQTPEDVSRFFSGNFRIVDQLRGANALLQDVVVLQKPKLSRIAVLPSRTASHDSLVGLAKFSGDPWQPGNRYFDQAELGFTTLWASRIFPFISDEAITFNRTIDLACGYGRNANHLKDYADEILLMDMNEGLIEQCKLRFSSYSKFLYLVGSGIDFRGVPDHWATFIYCFDAMVHFDSDVVRSYLQDLRRTLSPGGKAFFHHSNLSSCGLDWRINDMARNFMSKDLFRHYCEKEGLIVVKQEVIDWGTSKDVDCLSLVQAPL